MKTINDYSVLFILFINFLFKSLQVNVMTNSIIVWMENVNSDSTIYNHSDGSS